MIWIWWSQIRSIGKQQQQQPTSWELVLWVTFAGGSNLKSQYYCVRSQSPKLSSSIVPHLKLWMLQLCIWWRTLSIIVRTLLILVSKHSWCNVGCQTQACAEHLRESSWGEKWLKLDGVDFSVRCQQVKVCCCWFSKLKYAFWVVLRSNNLDVIVFPPFQWP